MTLVSLIATTNRPNNWARLFDSLAYDGADIEYVFVGPKCAEKGGLPERFRHIKSDVKPVQCLEIAARAAVGEYLIPIADDVCFHHESIAHMVHWAGRIEGEYDVIGMRYARAVTAGDILDERNDQAAMDPSIPGPPVVPILPMFRRETWHKLGGLDIGFIGVLADTDLAMRAWEHGGHPFISPDSMVIEPFITNDEMERLSHACRDDRIRLNALWTEIGSDGRIMIRRTRAESVTSFNDANILMKTQGERGRW